MQKIISYMLISASALVISPAFAGKELCPKDVVHCSYVSGLSYNSQDGRYIKLSNARINLVVCFNNYGLSFLTQDAAGKFVGANSDHYFICYDKQGKNCEPVGVDHFMVAKNGNTYFAEPVYYEIDLSKVKNKYPPCDA